MFDRSFSTEFDADGNRVFVPHLFVRKGELLSFTSMLDFLQGQLEDAGEPGNRDVTAILKGLQTLSATLNISEPITAAIPPGEESIFRTALDIAERFTPLTDAERAELQRRAEGLAPLFSLAA